MLPLPLLEAIQARLIEKRRLVGVFGTAHTVDTYLVEIQIGPYVIRGIQAVAVYAGEDAVIGRDVLNQLVVTLDRPAETTLITD